MNCHAPYEALYWAYLFIYVANSLKSSKIFQHATPGYIYLYTPIRFPCTNKIANSYFNTLKSLFIISIYAFHNFWHTPCSIGLYIRPETKGRHESIQLKKEVSNDSIT